MLRKMEEGLVVSIKINVRTPISNSKMSGIIPFWISITVIAKSMRQIIHSKMYGISIEVAKRNNKTNIQPLVSSTRKILKGIFFPQFLHFP